MQNVTESERSAVMFDGEISTYVGTILQGVAQGSPLSTNFFEVRINDITVAVQAAKKGSHGERR